MGYFHKMFPHPTGAIGLEDYTKAMDLLDPSFSVYQRFTTNGKRPTLIELKREEASEARDRAALSPQVRQFVEASEGDEHSNEKEQALAESLSQMSVLAARTQQWIKFQRALDFIQRGNEKPIGSPPAVSGPFGFPYYARLHALARLSTDSAFAALAAGKPDQGFDYLLADLEMNQKMSSFDIIGFITADGSQTLVLRSFGQNWQQLSKDEAKRVRTICDRLLDDRSLMMRCLRAHEDHAFKESEQTFAEVRKDPNSATSQDPTARQIASLSPAESTETIEEIRTGIHARYDSIVQRLNGTEDSWLPPVSTPPPAIPPQPRRLSQFFVDLTTDPSTIRTAILDVLLERAQLRILKIYAAMAEFRWDNARMPNSLEGIGLSVSDFHDPLSGKSFICDPNLRVFSTGIAETGEVDLTVRRAKPAAAKTEGERP
jgi:hypothetical protein